jgi:4-methyl-5(b-hydroxyethyl)-thiazole monophosphate biosynthesis
VDDEKRRVLVPLAEGFEEIEAVTVIDVLRRAGVEVVVAGLTPGPLRASRGVVVVPDALLDDVWEQPFDMVVLPGGMPGAKTLGMDDRVRKVLERTRERQRWVAAICAAPAMVLEPAGFLSGVEATGHPSLSDKVKSYIDQRVVTAGRMVTSQGPGTAMEFALELVRHLCGEPKAREVAAPMLARWDGWPEGLRSSPRG